MAAMARMARGVGRRTRIGGILSGLLILVILGCSSAFQEPTVRILDVGVASLGLTSGNARVELEVINPNRYSLRVQTFDYILEIEDGNGDDGWAQLATGSVPDPIAVAGRDTTTVSFDVPFEYRAVQTALSAYLRDGRVEYRFRGDAIVRGPLGNVRMPFNQVGNL